jgi:hypothetical protein
VEWLEFDLKLKWEHVAPKRKKVVFLADKAQGHQEALM